MSYHKFSFKNDIETFLNENYNYNILYTVDTPTKKDKLIEIFGKDGFVNSVSNGWLYDPEARFTFYGDYVYFNSEDDLIEFKLRFL